MKSTSAPDPEAELAALGPILPALFEAFEQATERAIDFFRHLTAPVNADLYPELVRYYVKSHLEAVGAVVDEFEREELGKNGLCISLSSRRIRMWKAHGDEVPPANGSAAKLAFLNQQLPLPMAAFQSLKQIDFNLVILWNVDGGYHFKGFFLCCPESTSGSQVNVYWSVPVPHPGDADQGSGPVAAPPDDDLPMRPLDADEARSERTDI